MTRLAAYNLYAARALQALTALCAVSAFMYGAFLLLAVAHAARLGSLERESRSLTAQVSAAQSEYLAQTRELTPERAAALGFVAPAQTTVVYAAPTGLSVNR